ncbi:protein shisa-5-like [Archocentrus centrarchus]|uniref:protein shisa-5-like n=1 Tax=Archocentrus centrarchus TaxID=63155 RepID=UPI0011EA063B|nr:protein shisa-5-like [Archocentrus centrarchus]
MSVMVSSLLFSLLCVLCVVVVQAADENDCFSYLDRNDLFHDEQACGRKHCCGECSRRYCCSEKKYQLNQELCPERSLSLTKSKIAVIVGSTIGTIVLVTLCVSVMICCIAPCCLCYKKCRKRPDQRQIIVINSNPSQQPPHPGYQAVPAGPPMPTAPPPSYQEIINPTDFPVPSGHPLKRLSQPCAPPPYSDNPQPPPFNPSYYPNS